MSTDALPFSLVTDPAPILVRVQDSNEIWSSHHNYSCCIRDRFYSLIVFGKWAALICTAENFIYWGYS